MPNKRLIAASNRLPVTVTVDEVGFSFKTSPGGLVTALSALQSEFELVWIGWPGEVDTSVVDPDEIRTQLEREYNAKPVFLSRRQLQRYYFGFSNKVLWPVLHYLPTHIDYDERDFTVYKEVNQVFADEIIAELERGNPAEDIVWVHDYQLMLVPGMVRERFPEARIGFFLHTPFPSSEVFRTLPYREDLLRGLLGASLCGFHTYSYVRHFRSAILHILGIESELNHVELDTHRLFMGAFPISIDLDRTEEVLADKEIEQDIQVVRNITHGRRMILSVDRLDYTKGVPDRLRAYKKFLARNPHLARDVVLVQIAVPSRTQIADYQQPKNNVEGIVNEITETYENQPHAPIHYIYRSLPFRRLCAFYLEADIALVTPYFDGMNLVAKEFVAVKKNKGVLILSEHAGAAHEMGEALIINPWNPDQISQALEHALNMPEAEQTRMMSAMYAKIVRNDIHHWSNAFLHELMHQDPGHEHVQGKPEVLSTARRSEIVQAFKSAQSPLLLLDYDGTLVEITNLPMNARPNQELIDLLGQLIALPRVQTGVVTGRSREDLRGWLGHLGLVFSCEHGLWIKWPEESDWHKMITEDRGNTWYTNVRDLYEQYNATTPGSFTEEKEASLAWHYRMSDPTHAQWKARELIMNLKTVLSNEPVEVISGKCVVEVRMQGVHKGNIVRRIEELGRSYDMIIAIGDDVTDEYLFQAVPPGSITIKVGKDVSHALYRVAGVPEVRRLLRELVAARK